MRQSNARPLALVVAATFACALAACSKQAEPVTAPEADASAQAAAQTGMPAAPPAAGRTASFDRNAVPVSDADMGEFPYVSLPQNYSSEGRTNKTMQLARFPFWVDGDSHWIEGKFQLIDFSVDSDSGVAFSQFEARRHIESLVKQWGGVKVSEALIPQAAIDTWGSEITQGFNGGLGDIYNEPASTYFIPRNDGDVWIHLVLSTAQGWMVVAKQDPMGPKAG